jgi:hypothetical protein
MTKTRIIVRTILRVIRTLAWSGLATSAGFVIEHLERKARTGGANLATIEFDLTELFAVFCSALAIDRFLSLCEKPVDEHD